MDKPIFPTEYFQDEVREGFYVSEMMKRFWAAQIMVLYEIVKICDRHNIDWYADMGTLLGAIRHKGYIPWDDDFDISMKREDWEEFYKYAKDELPGEYCLLSLRTNEEYDLALGRVTNSHTINTSKEHLDAFCGCPYSIGVDIFPIDRLYRDTERENERRQRAKKVVALPDIISQYGIESPQARKYIAEIERENNTRLHRDQRIMREIRLLFEKISMECRDEDYRESALMITWLRYDWANVPRECYGERMDMPFENIVVKGPVEYDKLLSIYYPNYMVVKRGGGAHEYPIYRNQEQILREHIGHNPYRYTFDKKTFSRDRKAPRRTDIYVEMLALMNEAVSHCAALAANGDEAGAFTLLQSCQDTAVALGTSLEKRYGEDSEIVHMIEEFCEMVYLSSESWSDESDRSLKQKIEQITNTLRDYISDRPKEVVFLPCRKAWWDSMKPVYDRLSGESGFDVYVLPIAYYDTDSFKQIGECHDESEGFAYLDGYISDDEYDPAVRHPDIIIMQVPFDEWSCSMTVAEKYYSRNLLNMTDELWYVPCFDADAPINTNDKEYSALSSLVEQPSVFNADMIILKNDAMRDYYLLKLTELTGEDNYEYWGNKIKLIDEVVDQ